MDILEAQERVTVDELVGRFAVSAVTIRGLERIGLVTDVHWPTTR